MTVSELIAELESLPPDATVVCVVEVGTRVFHGPIKYEIRLHPYSVKVVDGEAIIKVEEE